ncbi:MAG: barstar family protein [Fibrella sp.]|nr:barstar family protein [Armatimonadota bacterium]
MNMSSGQGTKATMVHTTTPPKWHSLSHHDRYRRLQTVTRVWCRCHYGKHADISGRTIYLDGAWINDIPSFYLSLGEAINGPNGYFGGGLDALSDCLCGHFGILPPLTIRLSHYDEVRKALDGRARCRWRAESFQKVAGDESVEQLVDWGYFVDGSEEDAARWTAIYEAAFAGQPFDANEFGSYFDALLEEFERGGARLIPENEGANG